MRKKIISYINVYMADVLQRYNNATQAYSSGISSTNEFQNSYNQNFYNDFLEKNVM